MAEASELEQFQEEFFQDITTDAFAKAIYTEEALFDYFSDILCDIGEFDDAIYSHFQPAPRPGVPGVRVDGYCGDPLEDSYSQDANSGKLGLIVINFEADAQPGNLTVTDLEADFRRVTNFVEAALRRQYRNALEETNPGYELAELISARWSEISRIKIYLYTNKTLSGRAVGKESGEILGKPVSFDVWDISRLYKVIKSGKEREDLIVDFSELSGGPLKALKASAGGRDGEVYLAAIPGVDLAEIYDRWGTRLLEANVRVFLQARSNVNKGIKNTLEREPELFFSFNNGLTATAERAEVVDGPSGTEIKRLKNLQIVNGGQTTASVHAAFKAGRDLSKVFVQMKLSVLSPENAVDLVPRISRSANSQNKVSDADFFSNHPFHVRMEDFSRRIYAPAAEGSFIQSRWYYERARGQYRNEQSYMTQAEKKKFLVEYPKSQCFTKTDLAKYLMVWSDRPYVVNRGAQKNFAEFAKAISSEWEKDNLAFNEGYYRAAIAKKIVFNTTERIVAERPWYESGGYRSQHVVLAIGYLASEAKRMKKAVDFELIWEKQSITPLMERAIGKAADVAHKVLMHPSGGSTNISEWAKSIRCWDDLKAIQTEWDERWILELRSLSDDQASKREARRDQKGLNEIDAQEQVVLMGDKFWSDVLKWAITTGEGTEKDLGILRSALKISKGNVPSPRQCAYLIDMMKRYSDAGCPHRMKRSALRNRRTR